MEQQPDKSLNHVLRRCLRFPALLEHHCKRISPLGIGHTEVKKLEYRIALDVIGSPLIAVQFQSHMGRSVKRVTGLSPARFMELLQTEESFWFYRLLEGHVRQQHGPAASPNCDGT